MGGENRAPSLPLGIAAAPRETGEGYKNKTANTDRCGVKEGACA